MRPWQWNRLLELNLLLLIFAALLLQGAVLESDWLPIGLWIFGLFCLSLYGWQKGHLAPPSLTGLEPYLAAWLLMVILSAFWSEHRWPALFALEKTLIAVIFFYLMVWHFAEPASRRTLLWSLFSMLVFISLVGAGAYLTKTRLFFPFPDNTAFVRGSIYSPNNFAGLANLGLFLGFGLVMALKRKRSEIPSESISRRALLSIPIVIVLVALGLSLSRGGWVAFYLSGLGLVLWLGLHSRSRKFRNYTFLVIAIAVLGTFLTVFFDEIPVLREARSLKKYFMASPQELSLDTRALVWKSSLQMAREHPFAGVGPGAFGLEFPKYRYPEVAQGTRHSYNDLIELAAESGLPAAALLLALLLKGFFIWMKRCQREMDRFERRVSLGIGFGLLAFFLQDMLDFHFQIPGLVYYFLALSAFLLRPRKARQDTKPIRAVGTVFLFVLFPVALFAGGMQWASSLEFLRGRRLFKEEQWLYASEAFKNSSRICAQNPEPHWWLARSYLHLMEGRSAELKKELLAKAEQEELKAISLEPDYPFYWSQLGRISRLIEERGGTPQKSPLFCYHQASLLDPNNAFFQELFARSLLQAGKKDEAKQVFLKLSRSNPGSIPGLCKTWLDLGLAPEELANLFANNADALVSLAKSLKAFPQYSGQLISVSQKAFELEPQNQKAREIFGQAVISSKNCETIKPYLTDPRSETAADEIYAVCLVSTGRLEQAEKQYLNLLEASPDNPEYHLALARLYLWQKQKTRAKEQFLWLASRQESNPEQVNLEAFLGLARIYTEEHQEALALKYYRLYLAQKPDDQAALEQVENLRIRGQVEMVHSPWEFSPNPHSD
jgi:O-antigen ligase/tetratricopeptide (TPR) repeat protein